MLLNGAPAGTVLAILSTKNFEYDFADQTALCKRVNEILKDIAAAWELTHWGRVTHISVSKQTIIGSDNGLSPGRRQAIIWTNAGILFIGTLGTNFSEILIEIRIFSFKKMGLKMSSAKWRPFCLGLKVLISRRKFLPFDTPNFHRAAGPSLQKKWIQLQLTVLYVHTSVACFEVLTNYSTSQKYTHL